MFSIKSTTKLTTMSRMKFPHQVITTVLLVIVAVFILCHSLKCFINLIELIAVLQSEYFYISYIYIASPLN